MIKMTNDVIMPAFRIDESGNERPMDSAYEQGIYYFVIGLYRSQNPFRRDDQLNRRLFDKGFSDAKAGRA